MHVQPRLTYELAGHCSNYTSYNASKNHYHVGTDKTTSQSINLYLDQAIKTHII